MSSPIAWVLRSAALGDFVATLPVLHALRDRGYRVVVVAKPRYEALFTVAHQWLGPESSAVRALWAGNLPLHQVDLGVAWTDSGAQALRQAGVRTVLAASPRPAPRTSIYDHLWEPLRLKGWGPRPEPALLPDPVALQRVKARLGALRPVVIAPGSGGRRKRWGLENWRSIADSVGCPVLWIGGPQEVQESGWGVPCWLDLDVAGLIALAHCASAWLGPDAGPSHVAAACGVATATVFVGATDPRQWAAPGATVFEAPRPRDLVKWLSGVREDVLPV